MMSAPTTREPCAVCGETLATQDAREIPIVDKDPPSFQEAMRGANWTRGSVRVHFRCLDRARAEFQPRLAKKMPAPNPTWCKSCEREISNEVCYCGDGIDDHGPHTDPPHAPVAMGCVCHLQEDAMTTHEPKGERGE